MSALPVKIGDQIDIGHEFFNKGQRQYNANRILDFMAIKLNLLPQRIYLAVSGRDIYVPSLNFVFGAAFLHPRVSLISTGKLNPAFYSTAGQKTNNYENIFNHRIIKEAVHEIGHTLGLGHCSLSGCVMFFQKPFRIRTERGFTFTNYVKRR
ncbi:MAG: matrixin family metalloprotease [Actinomycetota bacterium]